MHKIVNELCDDEVGGILAVPTKDTLKVIDRSGTIIEKTIDRTKVWHAQTPQMFRYGLLKNALADALEAGIAITDEASAMEQAGHQVKIVESDVYNFKVTTRDDLNFAAFLLQDQ